MAKKDYQKPKVKQKPPPTHWKVKALETLPEMAHEIEHAESPMQLWIEIQMAFARAYHEPRNDDFIRRVYGFADWCLVQEERSEDAGQDLLTCVAVAFYEHIPTHSASRNDMPRWFKRDEILAMKDTFSYFLNPDEFENLLLLFVTPTSGRNAKRQAKKAARS